MTDLLTASPSVGATHARPMSSVDIDQHPDCDRIWASILPLQTEIERLEAALGAAEKHIKEAEKEADSAWDDAYDQGVDDGRSKGIADASKKIRAALEEAMLAIEAME